MESTLRGAAAPRTPRLKRKDTLHAYRVAANATDSDSDLSKQNCESGTCVAHNSKPRSVLRFAFLVVRDFASVTFDHELKKFFVVRNFAGLS